MFNIDELRTNAEEHLSQIIPKIKDILLGYRFGIDLPLLSGKEIRVAGHYANIVLGSVACDNSKDISAWSSICQNAADIEYYLYLFHGEKIINLRRAGLLYELAGLPSIAAAMIEDDELLPIYKSFLARKEQFGRLSKGRNESVIDPNANAEISLRALDETLAMLAEFMQTSNEDKFILSEKAAEFLFQASGSFNMELTADECKAIVKIIRIRGKSSIFRYVSEGQHEQLKEAKLPSELWPVQQAAIDGGLLKDNYVNWGLAAPTGTGKTSIAQLLLLDFFFKHRDKKAFYIVPSRALASQVAADLDRVFQPLGIKVGALGSHLTYHELVVGDPLEMDILVFTPEKADLIMRIDAELLGQVDLVIIDEAHHVEAGTRGILLEFYLWRIKALTSETCRIVQLSAVAPNIDSLVEWLGGNELGKSIKLDWRTGRLRVGIYEEEKTGEGLVCFKDSKPIRVGYSNTLNIEKGIANLANKLSKNGIVLILASSRSKAEIIASEIAFLRKSNGYLNSTKDELCVERLDARLERELYAEVPLREYFPQGVVYHHGGLPNRVRAAVEQVISERRASVVCATTTLAEGVNFPFSTVIVESLLIGRGTTLSPRGLWNIAGRAGRFGVDSEGQCILYRPSLWSSKLKGYELKDYLSTKLDEIPPVESALAKSVKKTKEFFDDKAITIDDLNKISTNLVNSKLKRNDAKIVRGMVNMFRVGITHAYATGLVDITDPNEPSTFSNLLATKQLKQEENIFAEKLERVQRAVITEVEREDPELVNLAARIGWSLETQEALWVWVRSLDDWHMEFLGNITRSGEVEDKRKLRNYLLYPIAERMREFEGPALGGYTSYIAEHWIDGLPLTSIRDLSSKEGKEKKKFEDVVDTIYSKMQYLLPWALYGVNELLHLEASRRSVRRRGGIGNGVGDLSILASEGVPNFNALTLVLKLDIERVDATRLSRSYSRQSGKGVDIIGWFKSLKWNTVAGIVSGLDRRRLDPDLKIIHDNLQ